jgi:hypothetical protein
VLGYLDQRRVIDLAEEVGVTRGSPRIAPKIRSMIRGTSCYRRQLLAPLEGPTALGRPTHHCGVRRRSLLRGWKRSSRSAAYAVLGISGVMWSSGLCGAACRIDAEAAVDAGVWGLSHTT